MRTTKIRRRRYHRWSLESFIRRVYKSVEDTAVVIAGDTNEAPLRRSPSATLLGNLAGPDLARLPAFDDSLSAPFDEDDTASSHGEGDESGDLNDTLRALRSRAWWFVRHPPVLTTGHHHGTLRRPKALPSPPYTNTSPMSAPCGVAALTSPSVHRLINPSAPVTALASHPRLAPCSAPMGTRIRTSGQPPARPLREPRWSSRRSTGMLSLNSRSHPILRASESEKAT